MFDAGLSWVEVARWFGRHEAVLGAADVEVTFDERVIAAADHLLRARALVGDEVAELSGLLSGA